MAIPLEHVKEQLSLAYISAVSARAGVSFTLPTQDYGVDGYFQKVVLLPTGILCQVGPILSCQIKSTTTARFQENIIVYDMPINNYNKLVYANKTSSPCLFILLCLPSNQGEWMAVNENQLLLRRCCYWKYESGDISNNTSKKTIYIPRSQVFTSDCLNQLLNELDS